MTSLWQARSHLLNDRTAGDYHRRLAEGLRRVRDRISRVDRPFTGITPTQLAARIGKVDLDRPLGGAAAALDELEELYLRDAVYFHHPRYLAHLNCPVAIPALLGELLLSSVNSSLDTWDQSAGATFIERRLIAWTAARIGYGRGADGVFTSGGTQSNLQALLLAREEAGQVPEPRVLTSAAGHFSVQKAAKLLGLGPESVVVVETGGDRRMRTDALATELERYGDAVIAVVATAGTTDFGTIDPLREIADQCALSGVRLHVDAAYGCGLLVSPTRRHLLDGIERADSVTVDYHKSFFQPVSCSALLTRKGGDLRHSAFHADYLNPARVAAHLPDQVNKSIQTTRRFDALKLWLTLRIMGADAVGLLFDEVVERASQTWDLLAADPRFEVAARSQLSTVVFRFLPDDPELADQANRYARKALSASGAAVIAGTRVDGREFLKFTLLNPETTIEDVADVLDLIAEHAAHYAALILEEPHVPA
ncbi:pyridoxal phosphate-dependent decarboxylase family protein [Nonomuraea sp. NPDC050663]|uniref:pyridoxal phosphate-dependent decarboxylase family protein n=1 Tax=Nonomuraea sp. NPDC050663 TaxID=3364370 RepID=UPI00378EFAB5